MTVSLRSGAVAGAAGGVGMALALRLLGKAPIDEAIAIEQARRSAGEPDELFGRATQQLGGIAGAVLFGVLVGVLFAVVFAAVTRGAAPSSSRWRPSMALAGAGFSSLALVPFLKYPPNPPAVGDPATISNRTALYLVMIAWSVVATCSAWRAYRGPAARSRPRPVRLAIAAFVYLGLVGAGLVLLPGSPDAADVPARLLWRFRLASIAGNAALWAIMGAVFAWQQRRRAPAPNPPVGTRAA